MKHKNNKNFFLLRSLYFPDKEFLIFGRFINTIIDFNFLLKTEKVKKLFLSEKDQHLYFLNVGFFLK